SMSPGRQRRIAHGSGGPRSGRDGPRPRSTTVPRGSLPSGGESSARASASGTAHNAPRITDPPGAAGDRPASRAPPGAGGPAAPRTRPVGRAPPYPLPGRDPRGDPDRTERPPAAARGAEPHRAVRARPGRILAARRAQAPPPRRAAGERRDRVGDPLAALV